MGFFHAVEFQMGIVVDKSLHHLGSQEMTVISSMVAEEHLQRSPFINNYQHTAIDHQSTIMGSGRARSLITSKGRL